MYEIELVSVKLLDNISSTIKSEKAAGIDGIVSEKIKYRHPLVMIILSKLFNLMNCLTFLVMFQVSSD